MPTLLVKIGDGPVKRFNITREAVVIGRAESVDIRIDDPAVSRVHCQVARTPSGQWMLQDFGSRNHTYLGDKPVTKHELIHGDVFYVGPARLAFSGAPVEGQSIPGDTTLPVEPRDDLGPAEGASRSSGLDDDFHELEDLSDKLAEMASGEMTMVPDDPLRALADDASQITSEKCPLCERPVLPGRTYCGPCTRKLDEQRQAMQLTPKEKPSLWKRFFGGT